VFVCACRLELTFITLHASEILKKALDFLGNNLAFLKTDSSIPQRSQHAPKADSGTENQTSNASSSTTTASSEVKPDTTEKPRGMYSLFYCNYKSLDLIYSYSAGPPLKTKIQPTVQTVPPLENPEEAPGGGTALTVVPTSEWEKYWQKIGGDI
jgi:hypothetical protein